MKLHQQGAKNVKTLLEMWKVQNLNSVFVHKERTQGNCCFADPLVNRLVYFNFIHMTGCNIRMQQKGRPIDKQYSLENNDSHDS